MQRPSRRTFLTTLAAGSAALGVVATIRGEVLPSLDSLLINLKDLDPDDVARDETFWAEIRKGFDLPPGVMNLDHGYCNPVSREVFEDLAEKAKYVEQLPGKRLETLYEDTTKPKVTGGLARILGVPGDELALTRNATEALDTVIL
ncbi:MAG: twin-arginine translocation signal domain-containing protein, partial [bacterium]|nr:twin-arginine translocation signal domain-containing protein [bacterium]